MPIRCCLLFALLAAHCASVLGQSPSKDAEFFEKKIRPVLVQHCYECHSEQAGEQQGGLLLDRPSGWLEGGDTNKAVVPGDPDSSLLVAAVRFENTELQMPPDGRLDDSIIRLLEQWIAEGAPGPVDEMGETEFSQLGDQDHLFAVASEHWAFRPVTREQPPELDANQWNDHPIDQFVYHQLMREGLSPSPPANSQTLVRRLFHDLTGLPPTYAQLQRFCRDAKDGSEDTVLDLVNRLIESPEYGQHIARLWLDVARYGDTDDTYRPDTKTPFYFPFAFTYRDYVVDAFNADKPFDQFVQEQLAADLMGFEEGSPEFAALGFLAAGPFLNRSQAESLDDWIDLTTRGLMGLTVACARCHDHKFEPIPTVDYYSLRAVFAAVKRVEELDEKRQPTIPGYSVKPSDRADYETKRSEIEAKIKAAEGKKARGNNRSVSEKIRETELAELLAFHPGGPAKAMTITEAKAIPPAFVFIRGDARSRGERVDRHFLQILDPTRQEFSNDNSGRLELARKITANDNPLTARVFVNRVWGQLMGSRLVDTASDFGLQGSPPTHPALLDWLAADFMRHDWSVKHLVKTIVTSQTYQQSSDHRADASLVDPENRLLWRGNRKHMTIEAIRDRMLAVSGQLDRRLGGRPEMLWGEDYTRRRAIYGFINRFNLDPTLRAFDFPAPLQTQPSRGESIVAPQALFLMNSTVVIDQAKKLTESYLFQECQSDDAKVQHLFENILLRKPVANEVTRTLRLVEFQSRFKEQKSPGRFLMDPWPLIAQAMMMSNEFQYVD